MNQLQLFVEKAFENEELLEKVNKLSDGEPSDEEVIALAAEYGFNITSDDLEKRIRTCSSCQSGRLEEEELEAVAGGTWNYTENRWNPAICKNHTKVHYYCVGFLEIIKCDHYREKPYNSRGENYKYYFKCVMGIYDYIGDVYGTPIK